ncbi:coiled-coil domain-containing protein 186 isoform X2 [Pseudomyrmex gracilis]|uniref:coiled-coil domain-containing protein 186 isoform X2 n=1 Tax=Pseudomyrmex gracilis TaxID=219809 RepID=UPI000994D330|nr:coiled-coil domain-containing protein 186 isoform X2 [Pseudomyrmex gracilis]
MDEKSQFSGISEQDDNFQSKQIYTVESKNEKNDMELMTDDVNSLLFGACESVDIPNTKLQKSQFSSSDSYLPSENKSHRDSVISHNRSVSLSMISLSSVDSNILRNETDNFQNDVHKNTNSATTRADEEDTLLFNQSNGANDSFINKVISDTRKNNLPEENRNENYSKEAIVESSAPRADQSCEDKIDLQSSQIGKKKILSENNLERRQFKENKPHSNLSLSTHVRNNNLTSRPTLADDNKLVKMSLLANPINIMQSNVHLINKSRNFLNFITEKSTNIMERTLLPQHLAMRYNHPSRSVESDAARFYINNKSASKDVISDMDLSNSSLALNGSCAEKQDENKSDVLLINAENETMPSVCAREKDIRDASKECEEQQVLENNKNTTVLNEKRNDIFEKNDVNRLNYDVANEQARIQNGDTLENCEENKINVTQTEKLRKNVHRDDASLDLNSLKRDSLDHPLYLALLEDYSSLRLKHSKLLDRIKDLEECHLANKSFQEVQTNTDTFVSQIEHLEKTVNKLTADLDESLSVQEALKKDCIAVNKEKENMVMKYAIGEERLIEANRAKDCAERRIKELLKDQELLQNKLRQSQGERARICNILDGKCRETGELQKEIERLKEDVKAKEVKLKWTQTKLKTEMETQKETQQKLDKALMKINNMKEECDQIRRETQESFRKFQQSEENKAVTLDQQLKEHQARLILERSVTEDKETLRLQLQKELETLKSKQQTLIDENKKLSSRLQESEKARLNNEDDLDNLKIIANQRQEQISELLNKVSQLETLKLQLQQKEERMASIEAEARQLRLSNEELQSDMQACRRKEADMLDFTQKLTDKNVLIQSEFTAIRAKADNLESEHGPLRDRINELTNKIKILEEDLMQERKKRREECEILAKHVAEQTQLAQNFAQKLEDSQGENAVLKRKHQTSIKEMTRELQQCRRKLEMFETASPSDSLDVTSRTGSNTSLNTGDITNGALSDNNANSDHIQSIEPSKQVLMNRIIELQKINVKRAEKLDFLEEHTQALVEEVQKKTKIIQHYILNQNFGALTCNERDKHKHIKNKKDILSVRRNIEDVIYVFKTFPK